MNTVARLVLACVLLLASSSGALAIDPGAANGTLRVAHDTFTLTHAYAHVHDNAEGVLGRSRELRVLVVDRAVKQESLRGLVLLPVMTLARAGRVRGLLLRFRPDLSTDVQVTILHPAASPHSSPLSRSRVDRGVVKHFRFGNNRVVGAVEETETRDSQASDGPTVAYAATFSAPVFHEPKVTEDLRGRAAKSFARQAGVEGATSVDTVERVVVRGDRAIAIFRDKSWRSLERSGTEWKVVE